jgi:hypothetical protein
MRSPPPDWDKVDEASETLALVLGAAAGWFGGPHANERSSRGRGARSVGAEHRGVAQVAGDAVCAFSLAVSSEADVVVPGVSSDGPLVVQRNASLA